MSPAGSVLHERLDADDDVVEASPRSFGYVFAVVFAGVAVWPIWSGEPVRAWAMAASAAFLVAAVLVPRALAPLSRAWQRVGLLLHHVVNPLVLGVLFYFAVTPFGLAMRVLRKGLVTRLDPDPAADTYWISRDGMPPSDMRQQF